MAEYVVGAYLGTRILAIVAVEKRKEGNRLAFKEKYQYEGNLLDETDLYHWVHRSVDIFLSRNKIKQFKFYMTTDLNTFTIEMGSLTKKEVEHSLVYQIQEKLSTNDMKSIKYAWDTVDTGSKSAKNALTTTINKKLFKVLTERTDIQHIEDAPITMSRLLSQNKEYIAVVSFQRKSITMGLYRGNLPVYTDTLNVGPNASSAVSQYLQNFAENQMQFNESDENIDIPEDSIFANPSSFSSEINQDEIKLNRRILELEPITSTLAQWLRSTLFSINLQLEGRSIPKQLNNIYYTYDESVYGELISFIKRDIEIELIHILDYSECSARRFYDLMDPLDKVSETDLFGYELAIASADHGSNKIAIDKLQFKQPSRAAEQFFIRANIVAGVILVASLAAVIHWSTDFEKTKASVEMQLAESSNILSQRVAELDSYRSIGQENINMDMALSKLQQVKGYNLDIIANLQNSVINSVELTSIAIGRNMRVQGLTDNYADIGYFAEALKRTYSVEIGSIDTAETNTGFSFDITVNLNRAEYDDILETSQIFN